MASQPSKVRVTALSNVAADKAPNAVVLMVDQTSKLQVVLKEAFDKLSVNDPSIKPFQRIFTEKGAEVSAPEEIMAEDVLYFSSGENFNGNYMSRNILKTIATNAVNAAAYGYGLTSTFVKERAPESLKVKVEEAEAFVARVGSPLVENAATMSAPYIDWADAKLYEAVGKLVQAKDDFVNSEYGKTVDSVLVQAKEKACQAKEQVMAKAVKPAEEFFAHAYASFEGLKASSGISEKGVQVVFSEYLIGLRIRLGQLWNDQLVAPAKNVYDRLVSASAQPQADVALEAVKSKDQ